MILVVSNLEKSFGANRAIQDVSFELRPSRVNLLMGANGSGKSTLINCISKMYSADGGRVIFCGTDISDKRPDQIFSMGLIRTFQTPRLFENLSVLENCLMAHRNDGEAFAKSLLRSTWREQESRIREKAMEILDSLGIASLCNNLAYDLSGGQIKLLELAKILMSDSKLVLLDEPIAGINPVLSESIFSRITDICKRQSTTFLVIEHRLDIALRHVDYCFVLSEGKLIAQDSPDRILQNDAVIRSYIGVSRS